MSIRSSLLKYLGGVPISDFDELKGTVKNVERDLQEFPDPSELAERGLSDDVSELKDEVDQLKSEFDDLRSDHADLVNTVESLSDELENVSETVKTRLNVLAPNVPVSV